MQDSACIWSYQTGQSYTWTVCCWQWKCWSLTRRISQLLGRMMDASWRSGGEILFSLKALNVFKNSLFSLYCLTSWTVGFSENNVGKLTYRCIVWMCFFPCQTQMNLLLMMSSSILGDCTAIGLWELFMSLSPWKMTNWILKISFFKSVHCWNTLKKKKKSVLACHS